MYNLNLILILLIITLIIYIYNKNNYSIPIKKNDILGKLSKIKQHKKKYRYLELARYYHEKQFYDLAIKYYNKCLLSKNYYVMIDLGDIYHFGLGDMKPNYYKAFLYYTYFLNINNIENKYKLYVKDRLKQLNEIIYNPTDNRLNHLDKNEIILNLDDYLLDIIFKDDIVDNTTIINNPDVLNNNITIDNDIDINFNNYDEYGYLDNNENIEVNNNIDYNNIYYDTINDPQNIHDTGVNLTIKNSIQNLEDTTDSQYKYNQLKQIFLNEDIDNEKRKNINKVFHKIDSDITQSYNNKKTLKELFELIGNRIYTSNNNEYKNNAINNLILELNDCIDESDNIVCFTGVYNRIIDSLNLLDNSVIVKNKNILNQEILNKSSKIRNDYENLIDPELTLKEYIRYQLNNDYVNTNILKQNELDNIINEWIDYI